MELGEKYQVGTSLVLIFPSTRQIFVKSSGQKIYKVSDCCKVGFLVKRNLRFSDFGLKCWNFYHFSILKHCFQEKLSVLLLIVIKNLEKLAN